MQQKTFDILLSSKSWQQVLASVKESKTTALYDVTESQRAFLAAALSAAADRPVLYIASSEALASRAAEDAAQLLGGAAAALQTPELQFVRGVSGREADWQRLTVLSRVKSGDIRLLAVSAEALLTRYMPASWAQGDEVTVKEGDDIEPLSLVARLTNMGYERVPMVEGKGQCALIGDILNVFAPQSDQPVRIEFFDTQVDSIRPFDILTQRSAGRLDTARFGPALEYFIPSQHREEAAGRMREALKIAGSSLKTRQLYAAQEEENPALPAQYAIERDIERLLDSGYFPGMHLWANILYPEARHLCDLFQNPIIVVDTPDRSLTRLDERLESFAQDLNLALEHGGAFPAQQHLLYTSREVMARLKAQPVVTMQELLRGMAGLEPDLTLPMKGSGLSRFQGRFAELSLNIKQWIADKYAVAILCGGEARALRMQRALREFECALEIRHDLSPDLKRGSAALYAIPYSRGFIMEEAGIVLLTDTDVLGSGQKKTKARVGSGQRIEAFTDLSVGDYVVHEHHGIGIYQGTVRLQSEGAWRDYLLIHYRGSDKLYVPLDQFERVQKFIGSEDNAPRLNDLGSGEWDKQRKKVKSSLQKLAFDLVQLYAERQSVPGFAFDPHAEFEAEFGERFEYELTPDQERAVRDILDDMGRPANMDRLLCGDVGYGKTEVAVRAAFRAVINSKQVAFLAPTTILVQQHYQTIKKRFEGFPVTVDYISRFRTPKANKEVLTKAARGELDILVGTHRLLSRDVNMKNLGLLIVDEEQRFGVAHKEGIKNYKRRVDVLTLSATPIPRTLHMSMVGVRDLSLLESPPEERYPVQTYVVDYSDTLIRDAILREKNREGQVYFLYNRVADIDRFASSLRQLVPEVKIAVAHGQMKENALEDVMMDFVAGHYDVLLCTTIIENGIDIPRANTIIIHNADHFGLSQLYQLRGRVGRSTRSAYAYFTVRPDKALSETAEKRLSAIKEFTEFGSGFRIALRDLSIRGAGNMLGPEQSGQVSAVGYDLYCKMIEEAVREAKGDYSGRRESELDTRVELHINAYLPEEYVPGEAQRMEIYKRISLIANDQDKSDLLDELIDRFGEPDQPVLNLMDVAHLRALANRIGADLVTYAGSALKLRLSPQYAEDPSLIYKSMLMTDSRLSLQSGKRPALLLLLKHADDEKALHEGLTVLKKMMDSIDRLKSLEKQQETVPQP